MRPEATLRGGPVSRGLGMLSGYLGGENVFPILALFALNAVDEFDARVFDLLGPEISKHFGVGVGVFGSITLLAIIVLPLVAVPVSYLADRWKRMPLALGGAVAWGIFSLMTGLSPVLGVLIAARIGSTMGKTVNLPVHGALISEFYSPKSRAKAFGIHSVANPVGIFLATLIGGFVAEAFGWRVPFLILSVPTFIAILAASRLKEPERGHFEVVEMPKPPPLRQTARRLWAVRSLRYQWVGLAFTQGSTLGIGVLIPFFLKEEFGVRPGLRGLLLGIGTLLATAAALVGTYFAQRKLNERPSAGLRMLCLAGSIAGVILGLLSVAPTLPFVIVLIWLIMMIFAFVTPALLAITAIVAPPEIRSSAFALGQLMALAGGGFSLIGFAVGDRVSVRVAIAVMAPIFLRGIGYFWKATRFIDDDVERLSAEHVEKARGGGGDVLLETKGLTVSYGSVRVLFGVDLEIRKGEVVALLGTNGAGKSTTLNAISGIVEPDGGNVWFEGEAITGSAPEQTVRRGVVQVPGGRGIFPGLTVAENLKMGAFLLRKDRTQVTERMSEVLKLFPRLAERKDQKAGSLSGGERQMLTLAQSFLLKPKLLLIDELSIGLAPTVVGELLDAVRRMNAAGVTIVLVEQSVNIALNLADRAYFLEKGEVRFSGHTADLLQRRDLLRSVFLEGASSRAASPGNGQVR